MYIVIFTVEYSCIDYFDVVVYAKFNSHSLTIIQIISGLIFTAARLNEDSDRFILWILI